MDPRNIDFHDAQQVAGFVVPQAYNVESQVAGIRYPTYTFEDIIPVVTEGDPWGLGTIFYSGDIAGAATWLSGKGFDMPYADAGYNQQMKAFHLAGVGYEWSLSELRQAALSGRDLSADKAAAAKKVAQQMKYYIALTGRNPGDTTSEKGLTGLINDPNASAATATGTFAASTPDQILAMINSLLEGVVTSTQEVEIADTLLLPYANFSLLSRTRTGSAGDKSIMSFLMENNSYTAETGQPLKIKTMRLLIGAGAGGTNRMIAYRRDPNVLRFHLPMDHEFLPAFQKSSMTWEIAGIMRMGGTEIRLPKAVAYMDGI